MNLFIRKDKWYNANEMMVMLALNGLCNMNSDEIITSSKSIGYLLTGRFLNSKDWKDRKILDEIKNGIQSLAARKLITIKESLADQYVIDSRDVIVNTQNEKFIVVDNNEVITIFKNCSNPFFAVKVFVEIVSCFNTKKKCWTMSLDTMSDMFEMSNKTILKYIKELEENKLLYVFRTKKRNGNGQIHQNSNWYCRYQDKNFVERMVG